MYSYISVQLGLKQNYLVLSPDILLKMHMKDNSLSIHTNQYKYQAFSTNPLNFPI